MISPAADLPKKRDAAVLFLLTRLLSDDTMGKKEVHPLAPEQPAKT